MDLNQLLFQQQRAIRDEARLPAHSEGSRFNLVNHYSRRIRALQVRLGVTAYPEWLAPRSGGAA